MARDLETQLDGPAWDPDHIDDDVLRLIFVAAHPVLAAEGRIALTLRVVGGLTTDEIAAAFLVPKATVAQRIVRAKKTLAEASVPFEVPERSEYPQRLSAVLAVIYLIFNEGYSASSGERWIRHEICGRGSYALQAALAECHATAPTAADTDWARIVTLYEALAQIAPSPVVDLNRAVAVSMVSGPADGLAILDGLAASGELAGTYLLPSVRGELLARLERFDEAADEFDSASAMTANERERDILSSKASRARFGD